MGTVAMKFRIMPEAPDTDLGTIEAAARESVASFGAKVLRVEVKPFAFGLNAMMLAVTMPDKQGSPDAIEEALGAIEGVQSAEVVELGLL